MKRAIAGLAMVMMAGAAQAGTATAPADGARAPVLVVGTFHMSNPGRDLHNTQVDDVTAPKRQREIQSVVDGLARFHPTLVAVEWPAGLTAERWAKYQAGTLPPSHNEVVQLGFRLAKQTGARVKGIDSDGDFPFEAVRAYAQAHGQEALLARLSAMGEKAVQTEDRMLKTGTVGGLLHFLNEPRMVDRSQTFYREVLHVGAGEDQPGAALLTAWFGRNARICAKLVQEARPNDRVVVLFGAGHAFYLRQCAREMPDFTLTEADAYLPH